jgi:hypothetical protein
VTRADITACNLAFSRARRAAQPLQNAAAMRTLALLVLPLSLLACVANVDTGPDDSTGSADDSGAADDPTVAYATALTVKLTAEPSAVGNNPDATFAYTTSKPATLTCRLDGQPYAACPAGTITYPALTDGVHSFDLRATANGKRVSIPTYSFTVDTTSPSVVITAEPEQLSVTHSPSFSFTASGASATTCSIDATAAVTCTSPWTYAGLADGFHSFRVQANDPAGNATSASYIWTIDTTAPSVSAPAYSCDINTGELDMSWTASDANGIARGTCSYGSQYWDCTNVRAWSGYLQLNGTVFSVTYMDYAGNTRTASRAIKTMYCI